MLSIICTRNSRGTSDGERHGGISKLAKMEDQSKWDIEKGEMYAKVFLSSSVRVA